MSSRRLSGHARLRSFVGATALTAAMGGLSSAALGDGAYQALPFFQNWSNAAMITADDDWSGVPGIIGFLGQDITTLVGADPQALLTVSLLANDIDVIANQPRVTLADGGVAEFSIADPVVGLHASRTADAPYLQIHLDTSGIASIVVSYVVRDIDGGAADAIQPVALQYRIGSTGNFTNVPAGFVADATTGPDLATLATPVIVTLPAACENQPQLQIRIITANALGNDEWVGIDGISVTGTLDLCPLDPDKTDPGICGCGVPDDDSDGDGTPDCNDLCPNDPNKIAPGACGCGVADGDHDGDGTPDCNDLCPSDPNKVAPGACGCGIADDDSDGDGTPDCNDLCPLDPNKVEPGACGCGEPDTDSDGDGTADCLDNCPNDPAKVEPGLCGCGAPDTTTDFWPDGDGDGYGDSSALPTSACPNLPPDGFVDNDEDCDDTNGNIHPGVPEICGNGLDDDCNGSIDEGSGSVPEVWVDDDFAALNPGDDPDGPATALGCDAFATIQEGIDAVAPGGTVHVEDGTYFANVEVWKAATISGPWAGECPGDSLDRGGEAIVHPATTTPIGGIVFYVTADNVTIDGLLIDGNNASLSGGESVNGVDVDAAHAVSNGTPDDGARPFVDIDHLTFVNNIVVNFNDVAVLLSNSGNVGSVSSFNDLSCNRLDNMQGVNALGFERSGVQLSNDTYAKVDDCVITRVSVGVQTGNNQQEMEAGGTASISNNQVEADSVAIWHDLHHGDASSWTIGNNEIKALFYAAAPVGMVAYGLHITSIMSDVVVDVHDNDVTGASVGVRLWNNPTTSDVTIEGGVLTDNLSGIEITNFDPVRLAGQPSHTNLDDVVITSARGSPFGIVINTQLGSSAMSVDAKITVTGYGDAISVNGAAGSLYLHDSSSSGNGTGVTVTGGRARIETTDLTVNSFGVQISGDARVDLGDCANSNFTGLGTSTGGNALTGYDGISSYAIFDGNAVPGPNVLAQKNDFGFPVPVSDLDDIFFDGTDGPGLTEVIASQSGDADGDGVDDCQDQCPLDPNKSGPGTCGCGVPDADSDGDGTPDCDDGCPFDPFKIAPGQCGCSVADADSDGDGAANCVDGCPFDPTKTAPGGCGCGIPDTDSDGDGTPNCTDNCPSDPLKIAPGECGCGTPDIDTDGDGTADCADECPADPLKIEPGSCGCGVSEADADNDGAPDCIDLCPNDPNKTTPGTCGCNVPDVDSDGDGSIDCVEECPNDPNKTTPGVCGCGHPDTDSDLDGVPDCIDQCEGFPDGTDCNGNEVPDGCDILLYGTSADFNGDLVPDECQCLADLNHDGVTNALDLSNLLGHWGLAGVGDIDASETVDGADLAYLLGAWGPCPTF